MSEISVPKKRGRKKGSTNKNKNQANINENISETPVPKKRGRKPKENIIKNDNPVFVNTDSSNNLVVRLKKNINIKDNIESYDKDELYEKVDNKCPCELCWNCCNKLDVVNGIPLKYTNNVFYIYGYFCSLECGARYCFDNFHNHYEIYTLINYYYNFMNNTVGKKVNIAPKKNVLKMFGGDLSIEQYRSNFNTNVLYNVTIPPIFPISHSINTYEKNNINEYAKNNLKLYRKKTNKDENIFTNLNQG